MILDDTLINIYTLYVLFIYIIDLLEVLCQVCEQVQKPDGSVRTSPPFKSAATGASPPRLRHPTGWCRRPSRGRTSLYGGPPKDPSRGGSSRGASSGKSSRSSSRDVARDGDISSRCSSGCWETSTNSSEPVTDIVPPKPESPCMGSCCTSVDLSVRNIMKSY